MKIFLFLLVLIPVSLFAQLQKGKYYLNLTLNAQNSAVYINNNNNTRTSASYQLPLSKLGVGKLINNNNGLSLFILGSINTSEIYSSGKNYSLGLGVGHWYLNPVNSRWGFLINSEIYARYGRISPYINKNDYNLSSTEWFLSASPGVYGLFFKKILLQANINFISVKYISVTNDSDVPQKFRKDESKEVNISGILPARINLSDIQLRLSYIIN